MAAGTKTTEDAHAAGVSVHGTVSPKQLKKIADSRRAGLVKYLKRG